MTRPSGNIASRRKEAVMCSWYIPFLLLFGLVWPTSARADERTADDRLFVFLTDGQVNVYPMAFVDEVTTTPSGELQITLKGNDVIPLAENAYDSISHVGEEMPELLSFRFDKKYNDQLTKDCEPVLGQEMEVTIGAIGKWLTPTFQLNNTRAKLLMAGEPLNSSVSRRRMEGDVTLSTVLPGYRLLTAHVVQPAIWSTDLDSLWRPVDLTAAMLSTNQPSNYPSKEGLGCLLDKNPDTFFQSTWGAGEYKPKSELAHIDIALPEALDHFKVRWLGRNTKDYNVTRLNVYTSLDGITWQLLRTFTAQADKLPTKVGGALYTTPMLTTASPIRYLRLEAAEGEKVRTLTDGFHLPYLSWAELEVIRFDDQGKAPYLIREGTYDYTMEPYGKDYVLHMNWLADGCDVPRIDIWTDNGQMPNHIQGNKAADKRLWQKGYLKITGNGMYDDLEDSIQIKGRGNTSWDGQNGKSPYNVKFNQTCKPFGLKKGRNWVLQSNKQTGSLMANAIGMKAARQVGTDYPNHMIPVDLYINGNYRGHYNFTEKVGIHNNSVDIDDTQGVLFELELNYDEAYCFTTDYYGLQTMVKAPDLTEEPFSAEAETYFKRYKKDFNTFVKAVKKRDAYDYMIDVPSFARFLMLNTLVLNYEIDHPKGFIYKENLQDPGSTYRFGPIWDLDWGYGYEDTYTYYSSSSGSPIFSKTGGNWYGTPFFSDMLENSVMIQEEYYRVWYDFVHNDLPELLDYVKDYYDYAGASISRNRSRWSNDDTDYAASVKKAQDWLTNRCRYIMANIKPFDIDPASTLPQGDVNGDGRLSAADVLAIADYLRKGESPSLVPEQADRDHDGAINAADMLLMERFLVASGLPRPNIHAPMAQAVLAIDGFEAVVGEPTTVGVRLQSQHPTADEPYAACDLLLTLPRGMRLMEATACAGDDGVPLRIATHDLSEGQTRLLAWSPDGLAIADGVWLHLTLTVDDVVSEGERIVTLGYASLFSAEGKEYRLPSASAPFELTAGLSPLRGAFSVRGGKELTIEALEPTRIDVYSVVGTLVATIEAREGTTHVALPGGLYVVGGQKVFIDNP